MVLQLADHIGDEMHLTQATLAMIDEDLVLGDGDPKIGAHGKPVLFLHPKDFCGTLIELEQA